MTAVSVFMKGAIAVGIGGFMLMVLWPYAQNLNIIGYKPIVDMSEVCDLSFSGNVQLRGVPVARTKKAQAQGLSNRDNAGPGMLFAFDPPGKLAFWMRDTRMPLTIAFISDEGVLFALEDMEPMSDKYHLSMQPARFALELAQGQFDREGLAVGDKLLTYECRLIQ